MKVERGDTLSKLITSKYGFFDSDLLEKVKRQNPAIRDVNRIYTGDTIVIPQGNNRSPEKRGQNGQNR